MSLVDYESSGEESETDVDNSKKIENNNFQDKQQIEISQKSSSNSKSDIDGPIFSTLPKPRPNFSFLTDHNKLSNLLLNKKINVTNREKSEKETVKISVPSVSDFSDDDDKPVIKKSKPTSKSSGLFSVLPPPKNVATTGDNKTLIPNSVFKKQVKQIPQKFLKSSNVPKSQAVENDDDEVAVGNSFFGTSLTENIKEKLTGPTSTELSVNESLSNSGIEESTTLFHSSESVFNPNYANYGSDLEHSNYSDLNSDSSKEFGPVLNQNNPLELDEKALQILCGGKKKRQQMPMNVIDLSSEEIMPDSKEWLLKQLEEEKTTRSHSHKKSHGPSTQSRRKHQITYLAFQAKEQEQELKNQWANNRMSRRQTQSKYGF